MRTPRTGQEALRDLAGFGLQAFGLDQEDYPLHTHDFVELVYVQRGGAYHRHLGKRYAIIAGDFFVINTDEPHGYEGLKKLRIVNILATREFIAQHLALLRTIPGFTPLFSLEPLFRGETSFRYKLHLSAEPRARIETLIDDLLRESAGQVEGYQAVCTGLFLQILAHASRAFTAAGATGVKDDFSGKAEAVTHAIAFLESQFAEDIVPRHVAESVCMSTSRLSHLFTEKTGRSIMDYLLHYRLDRARAMLLAGDRSISKVAYTVGFHDPGYFSRAFRKHFGHSPRQSASRNA